MTVSAVRWAVNISKWQPTKQQWAVVLDCLPCDIQERCLQYKQHDDQKRAVVSQLLQRACIQRVIGEAWNSIEIKRTKGKKPFYAGSLDRQHAPNFNFNVSHEGDYVALACEGYCVCGVDVAAPQQIRRRAGRSLINSLELMKNQLSDNEWSLLQSLSDDESALEATFQVIWSCKEAFIKARGDGLGFEPLSRIDVQLPAHNGTCCPNSNIHQQQQQQQQQQQLAWLLDSSRQPVQVLQLVVDGVQQQQWRVFVQQLANRHWVAVARGPPTAVVDAHGVFKATMLLPEMTDQQLQAHLEAHSLPFDLLQVEDLLPEFALDLYST